MFRLRLILVLTLVLTFCSIALSETHFFDRKYAQIENFDGSSSQLKSLKDLSIDKIQKTNVFLYVTPNELSELRSLGFEVNFIPDPAHLMFEELKRRSESGLDELDEYRSYDEMVAELQSIQTNNSSICNLFSAGRSVQDRDLWVMEISNNVLVEEDEPEFIYISTMHGDEVVGKELCMNFINLLVDEYETNPRIQNLIDNVHIYIMPHMNPDGTEVGSRFNADGVDLNRSFPDRIDDPYDYQEGRPQEVQVLMEFFDTHSPVLAANFHGGVIVANFPYDTNPTGASVYTECPDDAWYTNLANTYAALNDSMLSNPDFPGGITNGADWYNINGGMQDYTMNSSGCAHMTIEVSNPHWPAPEQLPVYWEQNWESMIAYMEQIQQGIRGLVTDSQTGNPVEAFITVDDNPIEVFTDPDIGDFYRLLLPGTYTLNIEAYGYDSVSIPDVTVTSGQLTRMDVALTRSERGYVYKSFQMGTEGFTHEAASEDHEDQWHISDTRSSSSPFSWKCGSTTDGTYNNNVDAALISPTITLLPDSYLTFWHYLDSEISGSSYPYGYDGSLVEILPEGETEWVTLVPDGGYPYLARNTDGNGVLPHDTPFYSGFVDGREASFDLSEYSGDIQIRFRFLSDISVMREGWYIDDFQIRSRSSFLTFNPDPISFPETFINDSSFVTLEITNDGQADYQLDSLVVTPANIFGIRTEIDPLTIISGETFNLDLVFLPTEEIEYSGELRFYGSQEYMVELSGNGALGVGEDITLPSEFAISEIYPNPFNPSTTIAVALPETSEMKVSVINIIGQEVAILAGGQYSAGYHKFVFNGQGLASGVYFVKMEVPGKIVQSRKISLLQ